METQGENPLTTVILGAGSWGLVLGLLARSLGHETRIWSPWGEEAERVARLGQAVRRTTQRVNLFDKVLIPTAQGNIKRIQVAMADAERAAVVRSKISKGKREQAAAT